MINVRRRLPKLKSELGSELDPSILSHGDANILSGHSSNPAVELKLRQIFYFYAKQNVASSNVRYTFDQMRNQYETINLTEFM